MFIKKRSYFVKRGYRILGVIKTNSIGMFYIKTGFTIRFHDFICYNLFRFVYNTQQQRLHFTVHQIFKVNYTNSKNCALLKLERMHVFNTEYKAGGSTNTKLGEEYHPGQPLLWRPEALCIPRSVWSPSTFSSTGMLSLWNPLGSPALWCKYSLPSTPEVSPLDPWLLPRPSVLTTFWWVRLQVMKLH